MTRQEVLDRIASVRDELRRRHVKRLELFGSFARGDATDRSDVDLLVEFDEQAKRDQTGRPLTLFDIAEVHALLETAIGRDIDLVLRDGVYPAMRERIYGEAIRAA